jgi:hypothetical protein
MGERPQRSILDEIFIKNHFLVMLLLILSETTSMRKRQLRSAAYGKREQYHDEPLHGRQKKSPERPQTGSPGDFFQKNE